MKGRAGAYSFYSSNGRQIVRVSQNSSNYGVSARRSPAQQRRRVMWANLVNFYKSSASWMRGAFESKKSNETDYNAFMRKNLSLARIALTKDEASVGSCVVDLYIVSEGSIPSVTKNYGNGIFTTSLAISRDYEQGDLVSDFSADVLDNNQGITEGMQISLIEFRQCVAGGYPHVSVVKFELTLSRSNTATLGSYFRGISLEKDDDGFLTIDTGFSPNSGAALILSDSTTGKMRVSTENVWGGMLSLINTYTSQQQLEEAMESYGVDPTYFLESGSNPVDVSVGIKILSVAVNGSTLGTGSRISIPASSVLQSLIINCNQPITSAFLVGVTDKAEGGYTLIEGDYNVVGNSIVLTPDGIQSFIDETSATAIPDAISIEAPDGSYAAWEITVQRT